MADNDQIRQTNEFLEHATSKRTGILLEFWDYLKDNKKWWLLPVLIVLLLFGILVFLSSSAAAPFIYTLF
jgi:drug/metabolite transporter superfamily protein YnfA